MTRGQRLFAYSGLVVAMFLWGSSFIAFKLAYQAYDPMLVVAARMLIAAFCFVPLLPRFRSLDYRPGDGRRLLLMSVFEPCLYFLFEAQALRYTSASQAGMITALLPLLVAVAARFLLRESLNRRALLGFALAVTGASALSLAAPASDNAPNPLLGNFLELLAMLCAVGYIVLLKRLTERFSPLLLTGLQAFVGSIFFLPFPLLSGAPPPASIAVVPTLAVIYLGSVVTLGAYGLYNFGVSRLPASQATAFINLIPVFTVLLGFLVLGERFTAIQGFAAVAVFVGVIMTQRRRQRPSDGLGP